MLEQGPGVPGVTPQLLGGGEVGGCCGWELAEAGGGVGWRVWGNQPLFSLASTDVCYSSKAKALLIHSLSKHV